MQDIVAEIKERGHANLTRLTVLKKWFEAPGMSFGAFMAMQALRQARKTTKEAEQLLCEAREILADVDLSAPKIRTTAPSGFTHVLKHFKMNGETRGGHRCASFMTKTCFS